MYGKALCLYLQAKLPLAGIEVPFFCNEDWGWWLQTEHNSFRMGLCIYSDPEAHPHPERDALLPSIQAARDMVLVEVPVDRPVAGCDGDRRRTGNDLHR
jgi:hypothetical protein